MDRAAVKRVLQRYIPPLSSDMVEKLTDEICEEAESSQSQVTVAASSRGRTLRKPK
ncbi:MAG: hypothetical protein QXL10_05625 [Candidatus Bathyarchaeia archaeon]